MSASNKKQKRIPITVIQTGEVKLAIYKDRVFKIVEDYICECKTCPFDPICSKEENDADSFVCPCSEFNFVDSRFVEMKPSDPLEGKILEPKKCPYCGSDCLITYHDIEGQRFYQVKCTREGCKYVPDSYSDEKQVIEWHNLTCRNIHGPRC